MDQWAIDPVWRTRAEEWAANRDAQVVLGCVMAHCLTFYRILPFFLNAEGCRAVTKSELLDPLLYQVHRLLFGNDLINPCQSLLFLGHLTHSFIVTPLLGILLLPQLLLCSNKPGQPTEAYMGIMPAVTLFSVVTMLAKVVRCVIDKGAEVRARVGPCSDAALYAASIINWIVPLLVVPELAHCCCKGQKLDLRLSFILFIIVSQAWRMH